MTFNEIKDIFNLFSFQEENLYFRYKVLCREKNRVVLFLEQKIHELDK